MSEANYLERLKKAPISELSFDDVGLRRLIQNAGFCYLPDLLSLTDQEIDARFDGRYADERESPAEKPTSSRVKYRDSVFDRAI